MRKALAISGAFVAAALMNPLFALAGPLDLGTAGNYALVDLSNGKTLGQNSGPLTGSELLGNGVKAAFSGGGNGQITGTLFFDSTVTGTSTFSQLQHAPTTSLVSTSVTNAALLSAQTVSNNAAALAATQNFGSINGTTTITGNGGLNVIDVGSLQNPKLTLSGSANDIFVFNVSGNYQTNQPMTLSGGVTASHILFNFTATSGNVFQTSGGDQTLFGTYLATKGGNFQFSNLGLDGALINTAGDVQFVSGSTMSFIPFTTPVPSSAYAAGALMLVMGGMKLVRRVAV